MTAARGNERAVAPLNLIARLRAAGCVFAEDEAAVLRRAARDATELDSLARRRAGGEPLEHLVGEVEFGGLRLSVGPGVYVPRQRTLLLAGLAARAARRSSVVLETCAGVAPVAAYVARAVPGAELHAADVHPVSLVHAARNLPAGAGVHCGDLLDAAPRRLIGRVGVLVAVPPYVPVGRAHELPRESREHEPAVALYGGLDGLDHVRALLDTAGAWLEPDGVLLIELARAQWRMAATYATDAGWRTERHEHPEVPTCVLELHLDSGVSALTGAA